LAAVPVTERLTAIANIAHTKIAIEANTNVFATSEGIGRSGVEPLLPEFRDQGHELIAEPTIAQVGAGNASYDVFWAFGHAGRLL
jgi:hypothetical protein